MCPGLAEPDSGGFSKSSISYKPLPSQNIPPFSESTLQSDRFCGIMKQLYRNDCTENRKGGNQLENLRMMLDLAIHQNEGFVSLKDIADRQGISKKYLEQIVPLLNRTGMLRTNRGYQGGYRLAKSPDAYTVGEILRLTEGDLAPVACLQGDIVNCERADHCITLPVWKGLYHVINDYLDHITLQDVLNQAPEQGGVFCI